MDRVFLLASFSEVGSSEYLKYYKLITESTLFDIGLNLVYNEGQKTYVAIEDELRKCDTLIIIHTNDYEGQILYAIGIARALGKKIIIIDTVYGKNSFLTHIYDVLKDYDKAKLISPEIFLKENLLLEIMNIKIEKILENKNLTKIRFDCFKENDVTILTFSKNPFNYWNLKIKEGKEPRYLSLEDRNSIKEFLDKEDFIGVFNLFQKLGWNILKVKGKS